MELRFSSKEIEQRLLELFPSRIVVVRSIGADEEATEGRYLYVSKYVAS